MVEPKAQSGDPTIPAFALETRLIRPSATEEPPAEVLGKLAPGDPLPSGTRAFFQVTEGPGQRTLTQMIKPIVLIGRAAGVVDVPLEDDAASRYHAAVTFRGGKFMLNDMGSTNGTNVNGSPAGEVELKNGDRIQIGTTVILFGVLKG